MINTVDDHLSRGEQTDPRWRRDFIKPLPALLEAAREAGRLVVLVSDHGHVLDQGTEKRPGEDSSRCASTTAGRPTTRCVWPGRVLLGGGRIIAPWSERVRYAGKRNGYHGGASLQEVLVPLAVLSAGAKPPPGWRESPVRFPLWWDGLPEPPLATH